MGTSPGHPRPLGAGPRLLALLLAVAGAAAPPPQQVPRPPLPSRCRSPPSPAGAAAAPPQQVGAVLGGSVLLSAALPHNETLREIEWTFSSDTGDKIIVAEVTPGGSHRPDPRDRFGDRLDIRDTALRIRDLRRGDSGTYQARIKVIDSARVEDQYFNLSLYEPLGDPKIQIVARSVTARGCNVTVRCQPPAGSAARVTWRLGMSQGHLCGDSATLCVALAGAGAVTAEDSHTCVLRERGQQSNVTVTVAELCHQGAELSSRLWLRLLGCLGSLAIAALGTAWLCRKRRKKSHTALGTAWLCRKRRRKSHTALGTAWLCRKRRKKSHTDTAPEALYSVVQSRNPREFREEEQPTTIYSQVQM